MALSWVAMLMLPASVIARPNATFFSQSIVQNKHCSDRGGCDCDCSWASGDSCKNDDGSCCFACCCGGHSPTPSPAGPPAGPVTEYCPDTSDDFQAEVEGPPGTITWTPRGWRIQGQRRVSSKASFDLKGGSVEWDMDLSQAHGGVNTNFYVTFPHQANCGINCYCDSGAKGGCAEIDLTENNGGCFQATTWHEDASGGDKSGHGSTGGLSGGTVHMKATYSSDGNTVDVQVGGNHYSGNGLAGEMAQYGAVIYSSQWVGWVPGSCGGDGNLQASSFSVSNVKITGAVVQGPEPALCNPPKTPAPTLAPTLPVPTPSPSSCPGGSIGACMHLCPGGKDFQVCVANCDKNCGKELVI